MIDNPIDAKEPDDKKTNGHDQAPFKIMDGKDVHSFISEKFSNVVSAFPDFKFTLIARNTTHMGQDFIFTDDVAERVIQTIITLAQQAQMQAQKAQQS